MSGGISTDLKINGPFSAPCISGTMEAENFSVARFDFNQGTSPWQFNNRTLSFSSIAAEVFGSPVKGELDITFTGGPLDSRLKLQGENLDVEKWHTPLSWLTFASGKVDRAEVDLQGPFRKLTGKVTLTTSNGATVADHPFSELSTDLEIRNGVDISIDGKGTWHKAHIKANGTVKVGKPRSSMNITFTTRDLDIHQLNESYPVVGQIGLQGKLAGKAVLKGKTNELALSGSFGSDKARLQENLVTDLQFSFRHQGKTTNVSDLKMKWKGNSLSGKGTVNDLTGSSPSGTVSFTCPSIRIFKTLNLKNIKSSGSFEKDTLVIRSFTSGLAGGKLDLKGQVHFNKGQEPSLDLKGSSKGMEAGQLASQLGVPLSIKGNIDSQFSVLGTPSDPEVGTELTSSELDIRGFALKKAKASIKARDEKLFIKGLKGDLSGSPLRCSGTINLEKGDKDTLDVRTTIESLDLFSFTGKAFPDLPISGVVSTDISITGPLKSPEMVINAGAETFNIAGLSFNDLELEMIPGETEKDPLQYLLRAYLGSSPLELTGTARLGERSGPEITFQSSGKGLNADSLTEKVNGTLKHTFKGNFDLICSGKIDKSGIRGKGQLDSDSMVIQGYTMEKVKIPFSFEGDRLLAKQGSASIYGGKASMEGELDLKDAKWHMNFSLMDSDLARFSREFRQFDLESTGKADLTLDLKGVLGKIYLMSGTGSLELREGTVGGFEALKSLAKDGILRYRALNSCFNLDGGNIYLLPGSRVSAYPDDKVYKYLSFSGALGGPQTKMDLICSGQINTQALNALQGVIRGIVRSGNEGDSNLLLEDFISGLVGGYSGPDFRVISFELAGTWSKPGLYSLEVDSSLKTASSLPSDNTQGDAYQKEIKFEVSIPTGEGTDNSTSAGDQFKKQVMENLLKQIFIDEDDINNSSTN
jgi:translocation and assembly module TamB